MKQEYLTINNYTYPVFFIFYPEIFVFYPDFKNYKKDSNGLFFKKKNEISIFKKILKSTSENTQGMEKNNIKKVYMLSIFL